MKKKQQQQIHLVIMGFAEVVKVAAEYRRT